jgi:hypothetical protein
VPAAIAAADAADDDDDGRRSVAPCLALPQVYIRAHPPGNTRASIHVTPRTPLYYQRWLVQSFFAGYQPLRQAIGLGEVRLTPLTDTTAPALFD